MVIWRKGNRKKSALSINPKGPKGDSWISIFVGKLYCVDREEGLSPKNTTEEYRSIEKFRTAPFDLTVRRCRCFLLKIIYSIFRLASYKGLVIQPHQYSEVKMVGEVTQFIKVIFSFSFPIRDNRVFEKIKNNNNKINNKIRNNWGWFSVVLNRTYSSKFLVYGDVSWNGCILDS